MEENARGTGIAVFLEHQVVDRGTLGILAGDLAGAEGFGEPVVIRCRGRRYGHVVPFARRNAISAEPPPVDLRSSRDDLVDRIGSGNDGGRIRPVGTNTERRGGHIVEAGGDRRAFDKAGECGSLRGDMTGNGCRCDSDGGAVEEGVQTVKGKGVAGIILGADIREGGAGFGPVRAHFAGQAVGQPIL